MGKREIPEINAGSMADIAFLLLVFFLVTTTINVPEKGVKTVVPKKVEKNDDDQIIKVKVLPRDILKIKANARNQLLIEGEVYEPEEADIIYDMVIKFYDSHTRARGLSEDDIDGDGKTDFPVRWEVTTDTIKQEVEKWKEQLNSALSYDMEPDFFQFMVDRWEDKQMVLDEIGTYYELPDAASIKFETDDETTYGFYLKVLDIIQAAKSKVLNDFCESTWGLKYEDMKFGNSEGGIPNEEKYKKELKIVEMLYPPAKIIDYADKIEDVNY